MQAWFRNMYHRGLAVHQCRARLDYRKKFDQGESGLRLVVGMRPFCCAKG